MHLITGLIFITAGIFLLVSPDAFYRITEAWKTSAPPEPSPFYRFSTRFGGVVLIIIGICLSLSSL